VVIVIPGQPVAKMRARIIGKRGGFDPQHKVKNFYRWVMKSQKRNAALSAAFHVSMYFHFAPAASWSQKKKKQALSGFLKHTSSPDLDNLEKFVLDCANGILYEDDRQIVSQCSCKIYSDVPRTVLEIELLPDKSGSFQ